MEWKEGTWGGKMWVRGVTDTLNPPLGRGGKTREILNQFQNQMNTHNQN